MSCQKLRRESLHMVLSAGLGWYALASMDISRLFYPSREEAKAKGNGSSKLPEALGSAGRMPPPSIYYEPLRSPPSVSSCSDRYKDVFALLGKNNILCSDAGGYATVFDTETQAFMGMPQMNSPKGPCYISASIPSTAAHPCILDDNTDSLYIMDMVPGKPCSFEMLACHPEKGLHWCPLPHPPFFDDPEYEVPDLISFAVVGGGTRICVSSGTATYSFDTLANQWHKAGDWVLPFHSRAEYDAELGMWFGLSAERPSKLCALDLSGVANGFTRTLPAVLDVDPPKDWFMIKSDLLNLGAGRFCITKWFDVINEMGEYEANIVVFTGVEVVPVLDDEVQEKPSVLEMVKHKSEFLATDSIKLVL